MLDEIFDVWNIANLIILVPLVLMFIFAVYTYASFVRNIKPVDVDPPQKKSGPVAKNASNESFRVIKPHRSTLTTNVDLVAGRYGPNVLD